MRIGWMLAVKESARVAEKLILETCERQRIVRDRLTIQAEENMPQRR